MIENLLVNMFNFAFWLLIYVSPTLLPVLKEIIV